MKRVKVAKYTKEMKAEAGRKYREEQSKLKYSVPQNLLFIVREGWRYSPGLVIDMLLKVVFVTANNLCTTYTDKYVVEFALGTADRVVLGVICAALIAGSALAGLIVNCTDMHITSNGRFRFSAGFFGRLMRKKMSVSYEDTENPKNSDMMQKATSSVSSLAEAGLGTMKDSAVAAIGVFAYGGIIGTVVVVYNIVSQTACERAIGDLLGHAAVGVDVHAVNALVNVVRGDKTFKLLNRLRGIYRVPQPHFKFARGYYLPVITVDKMPHIILQTRSVIVVCDG